MYFAWLGHYTTALCWPALLGLVLTFLVPDDKVSLGCNCGVVVGGGRAVFHWLGYYTTALCWPALLGLVLTFLVPDDKVSLRCNHGVGEGEPSILLDGALTTVLC